LNLKPAERDPVQAADWLELETLYSENGSMPYEAVLAQIDTDASMLEEPPGDGEIEDMTEENHVLDPVTRSQSELLLADALAEIDRRALIATDGYPFEKSDRVLLLKSDPKQYTAYIFCLLVADRELYSPREQRSTRLFEHLVREALAEYMSGKAVRFGSPRDTMPVNIDDAIDELARFMGDERFAQYPVNATDKDLGLDVAGWRSFPDDRLSQLEVFMQCATGEDWEGKKADCNLNVWQAILCCSNERMRGLAIPYVVANNAEWRRAAWGLLFMDRLRIVSVLNDRVLPEQQFRWWSWCRDRIRKARQSV